MAAINLPPGRLDVKGPQSAGGVNRWFSLESGLSLAGLALTCAISVAIPAGAMAIGGGERVPLCTVNTTLNSVSIPAGQLAIKGPQRPPLSIPAGSLVYTGRAPGISGELQVGRVAYQGYALTLDVVSSTTIPIPVGALSFGSFSFDVRSGDHAPEIPAGQIVIKGPARAEAKPQPSAGTLAFTGRTLVALVDAPGSAVSIPSGALTFTGLALDNLPTQSISVPAGTLTLSGQYVAIAFKTLDAGSLAWHGLAPVADVSIAILPIPAGSLRHTGLAPTVDSSVAIPAGALAFSFPSMNVSNTGNIEIPAGSLVITGRQATADLVWTVPAGALTLTGQLAVVDRGSHPANGQLTFQGYALEMVAGDRLVAIPAGSLVFSGRVLDVLRVEPVVGELIGRGSLTRRLRGKGSATTTMPGRGSL